jgi:hypothetical protein
MRATLPVLRRLIGSFNSDRGGVRFCGRAANPGFAGDPCGVMRPPPVEHRAAPARREYPRELVVLLTPTVVNAGSAPAGAQ